MNTQDLQKLKELALAATPGPWEADTTRSDGEYGSDDDGGYGFDTSEVTDQRGQSIMDCMNSDVASIDVDGDGFAHDTVGRANALYVAAANPAAILELIAIAERTSSAGSAVVMGAEKIESIAHRWAQAAYCKALNKPGEDIDRIREELRAALAAASPVAAKPMPVAQEPDEESAEDGWRRLALQFDGHRMQARGHLRAMLNDAQTHAAIAEAFLNAPPLNGEAVLAQRIAALYTAPQATAQSEWDAVPQRWNDLYVAVAHLMAQLGAHGEIDAQSDHAGTVMNALHALDGGVVCKRALDLHEKAHMPLFQAAESALREYGAPSALAQTAAVQAVSQASQDVLAERKRQVDQEGWTPAHDDKYQDGELSGAASCYAMATDASQCYGAPPEWPWPEEWWKPTTERRNLIKAGALILAEIERVDRAAMSSDGGANG